MMMIDPSTLVTTAQIARRAGITYQGVVRRIKSLGLKPVAGGQPQLWTPEQAGIIANAGWGVGKLSRKRKTKP